LFIQRVKSCTSCYRWECLQYASTSCFNCSDWRYESVWFI